MEQADGESTRNAFSGEAGNVVQVRDVYGSLVFGRQNEASTPQQVPGDVAHFTGRAEQLTELDALLESKGGSRAVPVAAIIGMAGVGKTALVVHWAHQNSKQFPDGRLYVDLHGYDGRTSARPEEVLDAFLRALAVPKENIPTGLDELAALYRTTLHARRVLIILDNARHVDQVTPLLPASPSCFVLVTGRSSLSGIATRHGARRILLKPLSRRESFALLQKIIGPEHLDTGSAMALARLCAYLPLALCLGGERAAAGRHHTKLSALIKDLSKQPLDLLDTAGDDGGAIRPVFSWSYRSLSAEAQLAFRRMSLHPGADLDAQTLSILTGTSYTDAAQALHNLADLHLIEPLRGDRYRMHDLLWHYAAERAAAEENLADRETALHRLFTWYLHTADAADTVLSPQRRRLPLDGSSDPPPLDFRDRAAALRWCEVERRNIAAVIEAAVQAGFLEIAWRLPLTLWAFFDTAKHWIDWISLYSTSVMLCQQTGNLDGESWALNGLGDAFRETGQYREALDCHQWALDLCRDLKNPLGEAATLNNLGECYLGLRKFEEALACYTSSLGIWRTAGARNGEGMALTYMGVALQGAGRLPEALVTLRKALVIRREVANENGMAITLGHLGDVYRELHEITESMRCYEEALLIRRVMGHRHGIATALCRLGSVLHGAVEQRRAADCYREALEILDDLRDPAAVEVREQVRLLGLDAGWAAAGSGRTAENKIVFVSRTLDHPDAQALIAALLAEYAGRYRDQGGNFADPVEVAEFQAPQGAFFVGYLGGSIPVACGGWRGLGNGIVAELKRMYVSPSVRGRRVGRQLLSHLEDDIAAHGARRIVLETGVRNVEALRLYRESRYHPIPPYLPGCDAAINRAMARNLDP